MRQIIQNYRSGKLELADVPVPKCPSGMVLGCGNWKNSYCGVC